MPNATPAEESPASAMRAVRSVIAPLHAEPRVSSPQISQRLSGHVVEVLADDGDWLRVRGADAYEGWIHRGHLGSGIADGAREATGAVSLGCVSRDLVRGGRRSLPLGALLRDSEIVESGTAIAANEAARRFPRDAAAIAASAVELFEGAPYQWGGITPWGADCSGFVQTVFGLHAVRMPRDAWQQAERGADAAAPMDRLRPADLLFFSDRADGRITHVGIALGESRMVHLALGRGGYAVERLDDDRDEYVRALMGRFVRARRVV